MGTVSKGLSEQALASLPSCKASSLETAHGECAVCRMEYDDDDELTLLPCKHHYHADCIQQWLALNKVCARVSSVASAVQRQVTQVCPMCNAEVSQ